MYGTYAGKYAELGITTIPLAGKAPAQGVKWKNATLDNVPTWIARYPDAGLGALCGDVLTIVDIDDPLLIDHARRLFGYTPVESTTPGGGLHLWYRSSGEKRKIKMLGEDIDLLGIGGYAVVPPSPGYSFDKGGLGDIPRLPSIPSEALAEVEAAPEQPLGRLQIVDPRNLNLLKPGLSTLKDGDGRNNTLFDIALQLADKVEDENELRAHVYTIGQWFGDPLPEREIENILNSVMSYREQGTLFSSSKPGTVVFHDELDRIPTPDSLFLLHVLRRYQGHRRGGEFVLANAMAQHLGWGLRRFRGAIEGLVKAGLLMITHRGGEGNHDPRRARLIQGASPN